MKKTFTVLLIIPVIGWGQPDSVVNVKGGLRINNGKDKMEYTYPIVTFNHFKADTIPVIMLVGDTLKEDQADLISLAPFGFSERMSNKTGRRGNFVNGRLEDVWWMFGYAVKYLQVGNINEKQKDGSILMGESSVNWHYLDENKKQLSRNIIVWQSKNR